MQGYLYLLHFHRPVGNLLNPRGQASHYLGFAVDPEARDRQHRAGQGAALTRAAAELGIDWTLFVLGAGTKDMERLLKQKKASPRLCPICGVTHRHGRLHLPLTVAAQLPLPLGDSASWPEPPDGHWSRPADRFERAVLASWRRGRTLFPADRQGWDLADIPY